MVTIETPDPPGPQFNSVEWLEKEIERLQYVEQKWEQMFNLACHDRDSWQQQCKTLETIVDRQREEIRRLRSYERIVVIDAQFTEEELADFDRRPGSIAFLPTTNTAQETESEVKRNSETTRDKGQDSGETQSGRSTGEDPAGRS